MMKSWPYCYLVELASSAPAFIYESQQRVYLWGGHGWEELAQISLSEACRALNIKRCERLHISELPAFAGLGYREDKGEEHEEKEDALQR